MERERERESVETSSTGGLQAAVKWAENDSFE
jgi:hypothetical protein